MTMRGTLDKAQTFAVGITGRLTRVELMLYEGTFAMPLQIDVRATAGGVPIENDATVLASWAVNPGVLPTTTGIYTSFDVEPFSLDVQTPAWTVLA